MTVRSTLQINLHPSDVRHAVCTLDHQLAVWSGQVERTLLTVDTRQSRSGRYRDARYDENRTRLFRLIEQLAGQHRGVEMVEVDYSPRAMAAAKERYFAQAAAYPEKAFDGGPFHAYYYGMLRADADYIVHMDSDMLFGGGSQHWLDEAIGWFDKVPQALFTGPLPGPPRRDGSLADLHGAMPGKPALPAPQRLRCDYPAYRFQSVSTRIFVFNQKRFDTKIGSFDLLRPDLKRRLRARLFKQAPLTMPAEEAMTETLLQRQFCRIDFLGSGTGLYSLHPPYRTEQFYRDLPRIVARITSGDIPEGQRGDYDINASMVDWTEALRQKTYPRRVARAVDALLAR
jgi:hypothetical protein